MLGWVSGWLVGVLLGSHIFRNCLGVPTSPERLTDWVERGISLWAMLSHQNKRSLLSF